MLDSLEINGKSIKFDPETNFWGVGGEEIEELYSKIRKDLIKEMNELRFERNLVLLYVNPTDACNAGCPYCYIPPSVKSRRKKMSYDELAYIAEKAIEFLGNSVVVFHGTEPLLNKDNIFRIIEDYSDKLNFGIQTNGLLLEEEDVEFIKKLEVNVGLSLDSPHKETNDFLRGKGSFDKISELLELFDNYSGLNVVTTITKYNQNHLKDMVDFLSGKVSLCLMNPVRATQKEAIDFRPDPKEAAVNFIEAVERAIELTKSGKRIVVADFANVLLGLVAPSAKVLMCDISPCGGGRRFFSITADGSCYPCGEFIGTEFCGGNIFRDDFEKIINSKAFAAVTKRKVEDIPECRDCVFRNLCGAPCPAEILSTDGTMYAKSYYCEFYKEIAKHTFRVILRDDVWFVLKKDSLTEKYRVR